MFKINDKTKFFLTKVLPSIISAGILIYYCISDNNFEILVEIFPNLNFLYLLLSFCAIISNLIFDALIIGIFFKIKSFFLAFRLVMISQFYGSFTPFGSGGQPAQVLELLKLNISPGKSISLLSKKLFIYQLFTILFSGFSIIFYSEYFKKNIPGFKIIISLGFVMQFVPLLLIILIYLNKEKVSKLINLICIFLKKIKIIKDDEAMNKKIMGQLNFIMENNFSIDCGKDIYIFSFLQNISLASVPFFIAKAFNLEGFPFFKIIAGQTFVTLLSNFSPLPGSSGLAETSFIMILSDFFISKNLKPAMILNRFITYYFVVILSFSQFMKIKKKYKNL